MSPTRVAITVDGRPIDVNAGITVAAALLSAGITTFRTSVNGEARAPLCGMGICYECRATIDGAAHQRACLRLVENGMRVETTSGT